LVVESLAPPPKITNYNLPNYKFSAPTPSGVACTLVI